MIRRPNAAQYYSEAHIVKFYIDKLIVLLDACLFDLPHLISIGVYSNPKMRLKKADSQYRYYVNVQILLREGLSGEAATNRVYKYLG